MCADEETRKTTECDMEKFCTLHWEISWRLHVDASQGACRFDRINDRSMCGPTAVEVTGIIEMSTRSEGKWIGGE